MQLGARAACLAFLEVHIGGIFTSTTPSRKKTGQSRGSAPLNLEAGRPCTTRTRRFSPITAATEDSRDISTGVIAETWSAFVNIEHLLRQNRVDAALEQFFTQTSTNSWPSPSICDTLITGMCFNTTTSSHPFLPLTAIFPFLPGASSSHSHSIMSKTTLRRCPQGLQSSRIPWNPSALQHLPSRRQRMPRHQ